MMYMLLLLLLSSFSCQAAASLEQGAVLQELQNTSWISKPLPTWKAGTDPCGPLSWEGVGCDATGNIIALNLSHHGLNGPIPMALGRLSSLRALDLGNNKLCVDCGPWNAVKGDLAALSSLKNLVTLTLTSNELSIDHFPAAILKLTKLVSLRLDNTLIGGPIPAEIRSLSNLQYLYLGNNSFTKPVPWMELSTLVSLSELTMWGNPFKTKCPPELGKLVNLTYLNMNKCSLYGGLPPEYGQLIKLKRLLLFRNNLTGPIPLSWKSMHSLSILEVHGNYLYGDFTFWLTYLPSLTTFFASVNNFYGTIQPVNLNKSTTPALQSISMECNYISGPRPTVSSNITAYFNYNCFEGEIGFYNTNKTQPWGPCIQLQSCFDLYANARSGICPNCPINQHLVDASTCICLQDDKVHSKTMLSKVIIGCTIAVIGGVALVLIVISIYTIRKLQKQSKLLKKIQIEFAKREVQPFLYSYSELKVATQDFSKNQELGVGGYGVVYKGVLNDGSLIAIKQLKMKTEQALQDFLNEISTISSIKHRHLVQLKGCGMKGDERFLIYEFVENKNVAEALWDCAPNAKMHLDWPTRLKIIVGVGKGLLYLHEDVQPAIIHRDIKPPNILLDNNLNAKIADFGLALLFPKLDDGQTHQSLTKVAGTRGYLAPEYAAFGQISTKVDVFSYGVLILEIVSGRKNIDIKKPSEEHYLFDWAQRLHEVDQICDLIDVTILDSTTTKQDIKRVLNVAIWCLHHSPSKRPSISEVLNILVNNEMELPNILHKRMDLSYDSDMDMINLTSEEESSLVYIHIDSNNAIRRN